MLIRRNIEDVILKVSKSFPVISVTGPRQSGKTTLVKKLFPNYKYVNLENTQNRRYAIEDPQGFINEYNQYTIIDEAQYAPELFSYIQENVDMERKGAKFVLTGSQNFLITQKISQSLAGRTAVFQILPFAYNEIANTNYRIDHIDQLLYSGLYPPLYHEAIEAIYWYPSYISTYIERDVRNILNVGSLIDFQKFMKLCAARTGQIVNYSNMAVEIGITHPTLKAWLSVLESSHIIHLLPPFYKNYNKRITKSPKMYFIDTGLCCSLLGITDAEQLNKHYLRGALFETFAISELIKSRANRFLPLNLHYWRDRSNNEIDCIQEEGNKLIITEIKSSSTINESFFKAFKYFEQIETQKQKQYKIIYAGSMTQNRTNCEIKPWNTIENL